MSAVYFLIPGLRLPPEKIGEIVSTSDFTALQKRSEGVEEILQQTLVKSPVMDGASHLAWLWQVITKCSGVPETAAFEWEADGGPTMSTQTWRLWSVHEEGLNGQTITHAPTVELTQAERDALHDATLACVRNFGFQLQQWEGRWYLTRKDDWGVSVRPWCAQNHQVVATDAVEGENAQAFWQLQEQLAALLKEHPINVARRALGQETIDRFWPDGGSRRHLFKASTLRGVMSDDSFVWGWAQNAGLLNFRTTALKDEWPDCPEGDLLASIDYLYEPYRARDWARWQAALPRVMQKLEVLTQKAQKRRCQKAVIVAAGARDTHTIVAELSMAKGLFSRFKEKTPLDLKAFLAEGGLE